MPPSRGTGMTAEAEHLCRCRTSAAKGYGCIERAPLRWKFRRQRQHQLGRSCGQVVPSFCLPMDRCRGSSSETKQWILSPLRAQGYAMIRLGHDERKVLEALFARSREFFSRPSAYKECFKFYPVPGGYMTPYPGTHEIFELRRGLPRCPDELTAHAMAAFELLEKLASDVCAEVGRDIGIDLAGMPSDSSPTMRCIHYDRPHESLGDADAAADAASRPLPQGTSVRVIGLRGQDAVLNGAKATVQEWHADGVTVTVNAPSAVLAALGGAPLKRRLQPSNIRALETKAPGMYAAHTDSSLVTIAPRGSIAGLEAKDFRTGEWFNIEDAMDEDECLVFLGDPADYASAHRYRALMHRPAVRRGSQNGQHRISTPFFMYPRASAVLAPVGLPKIVFDDLNGNVNQCRDEFPWKAQSCYYSDMVYSEDG
eukprot:CAMPEP_0204127522 /NCGR_PEP_ID=MMETSP0361-20130328/11640_1 /ASSEMBLY_ACC=CAM_ASM_000343 /TAXON_ID=268821 /ORGANISM="Scrippsiella Hangoei, Strain SHTV-5" /LENGTH=425 /DNA_ID=CAMNT_0051079585 /DNA_START=32 /DNA_END=1306 /DNA_ORIENTATION=+